MILGLCEDRDSAAAPWDSGGGRTAGCRGRAGRWCCWTVPNQRWSLDFASDSLICGRRFRIRCVVDDITREWLALVADTSLSGGRVARELTSLTGIHGKLRTVVSDNGPQRS